MSGNKVLEITPATREHDAAKESAPLSKSKVAEEARMLIAKMREAAMCAQLEQLGVALGVFATLKGESPHRSGYLKMQSILQCRSLSLLGIEAARSAFWKGFLDSIAGRFCCIDEFDMTANSLDISDQHVVLAILNKLAVDGVSKLSVGHAFVKHPSAAVSVVESVTASCANKYLHSLTLTGTLICNDGAVALSRALGQRAMGWPKQLHLSKCNISDAGCIAVFDALFRHASKNTSPIGTINLSQNTISDEALGAVAPLILQLVQLYVFSWTNHIRDNWKQAQSRGSLKSEVCADSSRHSCFSIQELDLESNVISETGLKLLMSSLTCKSILKQQASALAVMVQEQVFSIAEFVKYLKTVRMKPVIQNLKVAGNLCDAPREGRVVHICGAASASAQGSSPETVESSESYQVWNFSFNIIGFDLLQGIMLSALEEIHQECKTSRPHENAQIFF